MMTTDQSIKREREKEGSQADGIDARSLLSSLIFRRPPFRGRCVTGFEGDYKRDLEELAFGGTCLSDTKGI